MVRYFALIFLVFFTPFAVCVHVMQQDTAGVGQYVLDGTWQVTINRQTPDDASTFVYFRVESIVGTSSFRLETSADEHLVPAFLRASKVASSDPYLIAFEIDRQDFRLKIIDEKSTSTDDRRYELVMLDGSVWTRVRTTKQVHLIYMNHLDVGYNTNHYYPGMKLLIPGYIVNVLNWYFQVYFPRAARLADELRDIRANETFIYTTHPWLVNLYLDCPQLTLSEVKLQVRGH